MAVVTVAVKVEHEVASVVRVRKETDHEVASVVRVRKETDHKVSDRQGHRANEPHARRGHKVRGQHVHRVSDRLALSKHLRLLLRRK